MEIFLQIHDRGVFSSLSMGKDGPFASFVLRLGRGVPLSEGAVLRAASSAARVRGATADRAAVAVRLSLSRHLGWGRLSRDGRGAGRSLRVEGRRGAVHAAARRLAARRMTLRRRAGRSWLRFVSCRRVRKAGRPFFGAASDLSPVERRTSGGFLANAPWMRERCEPGTRRARCAVRRLAVESPRCFLPAALPPIRWRVQTNAAASRAERRRLAPSILERRYEEVAEHPGLL